MGGDLLTSLTRMRVWMFVIVTTSFIDRCCVARDPEISRIEFLNEPPPVKVKTPPTPGCVFGDRFYDLEQTWHPELLQSGVLYCVLCQCLPNIDKGVLSSKGHVTCRDIKSECPEVTCDNPVLLPEQCCKTCPGQALPVFKGFLTPGEPIASENASTSPEQEVNAKHVRRDFIAILTGVTAVRQVATSAVGVGYFSLYQNTLVYTLHVEGLKKPRSIQIIDDHGTVFHSRKLDGRKRNHVVCGSLSWPDVYIGFLNRQRLYVQVDTRSHRDGEIRGEIQRKDALASDALTSLLIPSERSGLGGVVLVSLGDKPNTLMFTAYISGLQADKENHPPTLTFKVASKKKTLHKNVIHLEPKVYNVTEFRWPWFKVKKRVLKFLASEKLTVHVTSTNSGEMSGKLLVRNTCNSFWVLLKSTSQRVRTIGASGMVHLEYQKKGAVRYKVTLSGLPVKVDRIVMTSPYSRTKKPFCEMSGKSIRYNKYSLQYTGKGKCKRLPITAVSSLLRHQVTISVYTVGDDDAVIEGSINEIPYNENIEEVSDDPVLLINNEINPSVLPLPVGLAWLTLSELCQLHYQVMIMGYEHNNSSHLQLSLSEEDGRITRSINLGHVTDNLVKGSEVELPDYLYAALHQGNARLLVYNNNNNNNSQLSGQMRVKNRCNRQEARDKAIQTKTLPVLDPDTVQDDPEVMSPIERQCLNEGKVYQDMDTWPAKPGSCTICSCKRKVVECHEVLCPKLTDCEKPVHIEGECCPQCKDSVDKSASCYYPGDKRKHFRGAIWHPYVPPFGFMPCAVCQCSERTGEVNCTRVLCPELTCPEDKAYLESKTDCCKVCPEMVQGDINEEGACMFRDEKHYNGTSWHPNVQPFGVMKCVTCFCINGQATCIREKCPQLKCERRRRIILANACCPICRKHVPRGGYGKYRYRKQ